MIIVLLGPPGVGKGTQARHLAERFGVEPVATGDMIRAEVAGNTHLGQEARSYIDSGNLVPDDVILRMVGERMKNGTSGGFLLDGFPRTLAQAEGLERMLLEYGQQLVGVVSLVVPEESVVERLSSRRVCPVCGRVYNLATQPPRTPGRCDDHAGSELILRSDDAPDTVRHRFSVYNAQTRPLVDWYRSKGLLSEVDGLGSVDDVLGRVEAVLRA
ncbi:MAG: adenylate kinase [Candidatus Eisenbacteria bacterium]|nr:adenylate kinase [Candidatus Eisenbacteria bacterium]